MNNPSLAAQQNKDKDNSGHSRTTQPNPPQTSAGVERTCEIHQCLVCATKTRLRMILRIIQGRALITKSHLARAEPAPKRLPLSSSRTRAEPELSRSRAGPRPVPHLSVWSVPRRRAGEWFSGSSRGAPSSTKIPPCTGRARAQAARSELEPNQSRARAEPERARAEAYPASQCLVFGLRGVSLCQKGRPTPLLKPLLSSSCPSNETISCRPCVARG